MAVLLIFAHLFLALVRDIFYALCVQRCQTLIDVQRGKGTTGKRGRDEWRDREKGRVGEMVEKERERKGRPGDQKRKRERDREKEG